MINKKLITTLIIILSMLQQTSYAAFWNKEVKSDIGNEIQKEEYPDSKDVEPVIDKKTSDNLVIQGGVEEVMDMDLEE